MQFHIRGVQQSDIPFITSCFMRNWVSPSVSKTIKNSTTPMPSRSILRAAWHEIIHKLIDKSLVLIACSTLDDDAIFGFVIANPDKRDIYYSYVKDVYRRMAIATRLFGACIPDSASKINVYCTSNAGNKFLRSYSCKYGVEFEEKYSFEDILE